jgi:hypothetical protein
VKYPLKFKTPAAGEEEPWKNDKREGKEEKGMIVTPVLSCSQPLDALPKINCYMETI